MWKNNHVVMLPTQSKAVRLGQLVIGAGNNLFSSRQSNDIGSLTAYELYITSDEEIKEGEYGLDIRDNKIFKCERVLSNHYEQGVLQFQKSYCKKIIAITDTSLGLPQLPQQFIEKYIEEYNKGNVISDVEVEYDKATYDKWIENGASPVFDTLKVNPDNTINIKPIKDSWSREEVVQLFHKYKIYYDGDGSYYKDILNRWLEENL